MVFTREQWRSGLQARHVADSLLDNPVHYYTKIVIKYQVLSLKMSFFFLNLMVTQVRRSIVRTFLVRELLRKEHRNNKACWNDSMKSICGVADGI